VLLERQGAVAALTLSRPAALNALTWHMYEQLDTHLAELAGDPTVRAVVLRGDGGRAFAAGTDIAQFQAFTAEDGLAYERQVDAILARLDALPQPLLAAIQGYAVGGGMIIACACDLRYATPESRVGVPIARTLGNCLSLKNYQRLVRALGPMRAKELLFTGRLLSAEEAHAAGFVTGIVDGAELDAHVLDIAQRIAANAPLTIWAAREAERRARASEDARLDTIAFEDVVARVYGSRDFHEGVRAHLEKRPPHWRGE
jgi:enoyl-CoA hydratase/carnithine racemase